MSQQRKFFPGWLVVASGFVIMATCYTIFVNCMSLFQPLSVLYLRRCLAPNVALGDVPFLPAVWDIPWGSRWGRFCLTSRSRTSPMTTQ